jgi:hypothetical protein
MVVSPALTIREATAPACGREPPHSAVRRTRPVANDNQQHRLAKQLDPKLGDREGMALSIFATLIGTLHWPGQSMTPICRTASSLQPPRSHASLDRAQPIGELPGRSEEEAPLPD